MKNMFLLLLSVTLLFSMCCNSARGYASVFDDVHVEAGLDVQETYDDNITVSEYEAKSDMSTSIEPRLFLTHEGYEASWRLTGSIKQQIFSTYDEFNGLSEYVDFSYTIEPSKFKSIRIHNFFYHTYEPEEFPDNFGRPQGRTAYYHNALETGYRRELDAYSEVTGGYSFTFDSADREGLSDASLHTLHMEGEKEFNSAFAATGGYSFNYRTYTSGNEIIGNRLLLGGRHNFTEQLLFAAQAGIDVMEDFESSTYTKPAFVCSLTEEVSDRFTAEIAYSRGLTTTPFQEDVFDRWEISASLSHEILRRWHWSLSLYDGEGTYRLAETKEQVRGAQLDSNFEVTDYILFNLAYRYTQLESFETGRWYDRNVISGSLQMRF